MKMHEINGQEEKIVLMLHPMLMSADILNTILCCHMRGYRCLVPDLSAHGKAIHQVFDSPREEALQIHSYLIEKKITHINLAFGACLGATVLMELMKLPGITVDHYFFEGASFYEHAPVMSYLMNKILLMKQRCAISNPARAINKMMAICGEDAAMPMTEQFCSVCKYSMGRIVKGCSYVQLPCLTCEQQKKCTFAYGGLDADLGRARKRIAKLYPHAELRLWHGYGHCEKISADPGNYALQLESYI